MFVQRNYVILLHMAIVGNGRRCQEYSIDATPSICRPHEVSSSALSPPTLHHLPYSAAVTALATKPLANIPTTPSPPRPLTINAQLAMTHHLLNLPLLLQIIQRLSCQTAIDL